MQTMKLNNYIKEEFYILYQLASIAGYEDIAAKLNADYHWLADMEKEKSE